MKSTKGIKSGGDDVFVLAGAGDRTSFKENEENSTQPSEETERTEEYHRRVTQSTSQRDSNNNDDDDDDDDENHHDARTSSFSAFTAVGGANVGASLASSSFAVRGTRKRRSRLRQSTPLRKRNKALAASRPQPSYLWTHINHQNGARGEDAAVLDETAVEEDGGAETLDNEVMDELGQSDNLFDNDNNAISRDEESGYHNGDASGLEEERAGVDDAGLEEERAGVADDMDSEEVTDEARAEESGEETEVNNDVETTWERGVLSFRGQIDPDKMPQSVFDVDNRKSNGVPKKKWREAIVQGRGEKKRIRGRTILPPDDIIRRVTSLSFNPKFEE